MARTEKYFIGPALLGEIRQTITRVSSEPYRISNQPTSPRLESIPRRTPAQQLLLGKPTGLTAWAKDSVSDVTVFDDGEPLLETASSPARVIENVVNKLITVNAGDWVIIGRIGNRWYLVSAEC